MYVISLQSHQNFKAHHIPYSHILHSRQITSITFLFHLYPKLVKLCMKCYRKTCNDQDDKEAEDSRPSPALVPVPYMSHTNVASKLIKKKLPVLEFGMLQSGGKEDGEDSACRAICLSLIGTEEEVRLLANCLHVYHSECLDEWVDLGHVTCPLCQPKLLPPAADAHEEADCPKGDQRDPWREERIAYLFGEDFVMEKLLNLPTSVSCFNITRHINDDAERRRNE